MKKRMVIALVVGFMCWQYVTLISLNIIYGEENKTAEDSVEKANKFLQDHLNYGGDYFGMKGLKGGHIIKDLAIKGNGSFGDLPVLVYETEAGATVEATNYGNDTRQWDSEGDSRALGYAFSGKPYANPDFFIDDVTYNRRWIKEPWKLPHIGEKVIKKQLSPDDPRDVHTSQWLDYQPNTFASTYSVINQWIAVNNAFLPENIENKTGNRKFFNKNIHGTLPPGIASNPEDYIYIIQPPTYESWGIGIAYYYYGGTGADNMSKPNNYSYYEYFRYEPYALQEEDLSVSFDPIISSGVEETEVTIGVRVESTYKRELADVSYEWVITKEDGTPITDVTYTGHSTVGSGDFSLFPKEGERMVYGTFTLPKREVSSKVKVRYEINEKGTKPSENYLDNNKIEETIDVLAVQPPTVGQLDLDYNVLSRDVAYSLPSNSATLRLPRGGWVGNATGNLNVNNQASIFHNFAVKYNPPVNEASATISRKPEIHTTLERSDFESSHWGGGYTNVSDPHTPIKKMGEVSYGGSVSRPYRYFYTCGSPFCRGHIGGGTAWASFQSGTDTREISTYIYNGRPYIVPKSYEDKIDKNTIYEQSKKLWWTSEPYKYNVIRWMCHQDESDNLHSWTPIDGQYRRTFTQQNSGEVIWSIESNKGMTEEYEQGREAAKKRKNNRNLYDKAAFATDKERQHEDYPIRSGYYFNPTGSYTFTVKTVTYKPTTADTKEHQDLVDETIDAFRYESDLIYINSHKEAVNLQNQRLTESGNDYRRKVASLTAMDPTGVDDRVLLKVLDRSKDPTRYTKKVEEIKHSQDSGAYTHEYWKEIIEGYTESGTYDSKSDYKYREYIKDNQYMYRISEETEVTIEINESNSKVYTHARMADGDYRVRVWIDNIDLAGTGNEYGKIGTVVGIGSLDEIKVTVKGSMYDDVNN